MNSTAQLIDVIRVQLVGFGHRHILKCMHWKLIWLKQLGSMISRILCGKQFNQHQLAFLSIVNFFCVWAQLWHNQRIIAIFILKMIILAHKLIKSNNFIIDYQVMESTGSTPMILIHSKLYQEISKIPLSIASHLCTLYIVIIAYVKIVYQLLNAHCLDLLSFDSANQCPAHCDDSVISFVIRMFLFQFLARAQPLNGIFMTFSCCNRIVIGINRTATACFWLFSVR